MDVAFQLPALQLVLRQLAWHRFILRPRGRAATAFI